MKIEQKDEDADMIDKKDELLIALLHDSCGDYDLQIFKYINYPLEECVRRLMNEGLDVTFNALMREVFAYGIDEIEEAVILKLQYLDGLDDVNEDKKEERDLICRLDPQSDIQSFHNCSDTSIWFEKNGGIYHRYFQEELEHFYDMTGFEIMD